MVSASRRGAVAIGRGIAALGYFPELVGGELTRLIRRQHAELAWHQTAGAAFLCTVLHQPTRGDARLPSAPGNPSRRRRRCPTRTRRGRPGLRGISSAAVCGCPTARPAPRSCRLPRRPRSCSVSCRIGVPSCSRRRPESAITPACRRIGSRCERVLVWPECDVTVIPAMTQPPKALPKAFRITRRIAKGEPDDFGVFVGQGPRVGGSLLRSGAGGGRQRIHRVLSSGRPRCPRTRPMSAAPALRRYASTTDKLFIAGSARAG